MLGAESNTSPTSPDVIDLHQGYLELSGSIRPADISVRAGRQEIILGNERLVGAGGWTNTGRSFDGLRVLLAPPGSSGLSQWTATAFVATIDERGRRFGGSQSGSQPGDHAAAALYMTRRLGTNATVDATALIDNGSRYRTYENSDRATFDGRMQARAAGLQWEMEGAVQRGTQDYVPAPGSRSAQRVQAWLAGARVAVPEVAAHRWTVSVGTDVLSGDRAPGDGTYRAFNTMFATNHPFYGLMDVFVDPAARTADAGLADAFATGGWRFSKDAKLRAEIHRFRTQQSSGTIGWEGDLVLPYRVSAASTVETGYSVFRAGQDAQPLGLGVPGTLRNWAYLQMRASF